MNSYDVWLAIALLTLVTVVGRTAFLFAPAAWYPRGALARALSYTPLAALLAIAAPEVFRHWLDAAAAGSSPTWPLLFDARVVAAATLLLLLKTVRNEFLSLFGAGALFWLLS